MHRRPEILAFVLVLVIVLSAVLLALAHVDEPSWFQPLAFTALGAGAGAAVPARARSAT